MVGGCGTSLYRTFIDGGYTSLDYCLCFYPFLGVKGVWLM